MHHPSWPPGQRLSRRAFLALSSGASAALLSGCGGSASPAASPPPGTALTPLLASLQQQTFNYFWETTDPVLGLAPDRYPNPPFASIAAVGFALTAYPIGVENGWITRTAAAQRAQATLRLLWNAPQGAASSGCAGYQGFFYHLLDMQTGTRSGSSEISIIDTTLLMAGVLFCGEYFNQSTTTESSIGNWPRTSMGRSTGPGPRHVHLPSAFHGLRRVVSRPMTALVTTRA
jgi:hypothetical protein